MPRATVMDRPTGMVQMQGVWVPETHVDIEGFFDLTRRQTLTNKASTAYAGLGSADQVTILQTGIIAAATIKLSGTVTATPGTGTIASTARWPYDLLKSVRFAANGQNNLIQCSGAKLKARELVGNGDGSDRGVAAAIGGAHPGTSRTQGTMSLDSEAWGVGSNTTAIAAGTYTFELSVLVPIAFDMRTLVGAIFAQTQATDLGLELTWASQSDLFTLTGNAAVAVACNYTVSTEVFSIPTADGSPIVPDLTAFHSLYQHRVTPIGNGPGEYVFPGQGIGRQMMRVLFQVFNGAAGVPLPLTAANFGQIGWRYGGNDTPDVWPDGLALRQANERVYNTDLGAFHGVGVVDFSNEHAFRDSVDEGNATGLRLLVEIPNAVALVGGAIEIVRETLSSGAAA